MRERESEREIKRVRERNKKASVRNREREKRGRIRGRERVRGKDGIRYRKRERVIQTGGEREWMIERERESKKGRKSECLR